jgi:ABC-type transport system involved in multi-copper enzyme maturation permease subunit
MSIVVKDPLAVAAIYLWIGFVCAISFMEAGLKFKAPGVNMQIGLGIGRLVFSALNKTEWVFAIAIFFSFFITKQSLFSINNLFYYIPFILLFIQTIWLLPALDKRAEMRINGMEVEASSLHIYYVVVEVIKVISLLIFSVKQFK